MADADNGLIFCVRDSRKNPGTFLRRYDLIMNNA